MALNKISTLIESNMLGLAIAGAKLGADYGSKIGKNPLHKARLSATGALIGSGIGTFMGAGLDAAIAIPK